MPSSRRDQRRKGFSGVFTYRNPLLHIDDDGQPSTPDDGTSFLIRDENPSEDIQLAQHRALRYHPTDEEDPRSRQSSVHLAPPDVSVHAGDQAPSMPSTHVPRPRVCT